MPARRQDARLRHASACLAMAAMWACLLSAAVMAGAQPSAQLSGSVQDATGVPLADVAVSVEGPETRVVYSGADGQFLLEGLPGGEYELKAALPQFAPARRTVLLAPGETVTLSLTLSILVLEQTIVTAAKIGERDVQDTPMAVSVLTGSDLRRGQANTVAQIAGLAPAVTFSQNSDYAQLSIRGIGSNVTFAGSDPSAAVYIDGVYIARPVMVLTDFLDLERVEVLRGPQGTLYGRNAIGGALNIITRSPTNDVEASARLVAGTRNTFRTEARVSGPLVRSKVMGSAAFLRGVSRGFVRDLDHPDEPLGSEDVTAVQGKLQFVLPRRSSLLVSADLTHKEPTPLVYAKVLAVKPGFDVDNPVDLHEVRTSTLSTNRTSEYGAAARFTTRLGETTTLTSLTAFRKLDFDNRNDADITELELAAGHVREVQHQWSEEITLAQRRRRVNWLAGLFFFDEVDRQPVSVRLGGPRLENRFEATVDADASAVFGQATIALTGRLSTTAGLRYSRERKSIASSGALSTLDAPITVLPASVYAFTDAISHTAWTPRVGLEVRAREGVLGYVSATRGFKSGGFNLTSPEAGRGYAPEWAWSYEAGIKTELVGGRARINAAVFETDYSDLQVQTAIRPGIIDISNAAEATIRGVEVEAATRVTRALEAGGHLAWLDAAYDRYVAVGVGGITGNAAGHRLNNAPEWSGRLWLEWTNEVGRALLSARADARWQSTVFFTPFNDKVQRQRPYGLVDVSAEVGPRHRHWFVEVYAKNLTNEDFITGTFSSPPPAIGGRPGEPRQAGVQLTLQRPTR